MPLDSVMPANEKRWLRYDFTAVEVHELSVEMANKIQELQSVEQEKKSVTSSYTSKMNMLKENVGSLSNKVTSGYEIKEVECAIEYHKPAQGKKTLMRADNGQKIIEKMTEADYTLWNQFNDTDATKGLSATN